MPEGLSRLLKRGATCEHERNDISELFGLPEQPTEGCNELQPCRHPQRRLHTTAAATQPATNDGTDEQEHHTSDTAIALDIIGRLLENLRVRRDIEVDTCQNHCRDLIVSQRATAGHTTGGLESQQSNGDELQEQRSTIQGRILRGVWDEIGLNDSDGDNDEGCLHEEGHEKGTAAEGADRAHGDGEDHCAGEEGGDGDKGFEPTPWLAGRLIGCAEAKENGVTCS